MTTVRTSGAHGLLDKPGGIFIRRSDQMPEEERILLHRPRQTESARQAEAAQPALRPEDIKIAQ